MAIEHFEYSPPADLAPYVQRFLHSRRPDGDPEYLPVPPTGSHYLTYVDTWPLEFWFDDDYLGDVSSLFVGGQLYRKQPVARVNGPLVMLGAQFTPTGFHRLFGNDCALLVDAVHAVSRVVGEADQWQTRLVEATDTDAKMKVLQSLLRSRLSHASSATRVDDMVVYAQQRRGYVTVEQLSQTFALGSRQLNRRFAKEVGVPPKHWLKVTQLKCAIEALQSDDSRELSYVAQLAGYYDQAHFIHDFQRYVGTSPMGFLRDKNPFLRFYLKQVAQS